MKTSNALAFSNGKSSWPKSTKYFKITNVSHRCPVSRMTNCFWPTTETETETATATATIAETEGNRTIFV